MSDKHYDEATAKALKVMQEAVMAYINNAGYGAWVGRDTVNQISDYAIKRLLAAGFQITVKPGA